MKLIFKEKVSASSCQLFLDCEVSPYKYRHTTVAEACTFNSFYCYLDDNSNIKLKTSNRYYSQIQGQMGVNVFKQCDFVIFTTKDLQIVPVTFNPQF